MIYPLFVTLWLVGLCGCATISSASDKFAFVEGIPEPDVEARLIRRGTLKLPQPLHATDSVPSPVGATVTVVFIVEADGSVGEAAADAPNPRLGEAAVRAIKRSVFVPAMTDGKPVRSVQTDEWRFDAADFLPDPS